MRRNYTTREDETIRERMLQGIADGRKLTDVADELSRELGRSAKGIMTRWHRDLSDESERVRSNVQMPRKPWSTRLPLDTWATLKALSQVNGNDMTDVVDKALWGYLNTLDDETRQKIRDARDAIIEEADVDG